MISSEYFNNSILMRLHSFKLPFDDEEYLPFLCLNDVAEERETDSLLYQLFVEPSYLAFHGKRAYETK